MSELHVRVVSQEALDADGQFQSHQWAEIPPPLSIAYMSGGLKKVRRLFESYFTFRFSAAAGRVRGRWRKGEPTLSLRFYRLPFLHGRPLVHLGRLRTGGTQDVYRGIMEIRGGTMLDPAAALLPRPWPADMPWMAPSAGEFDVQLEAHRPSYLGVFEMRVQRAPAGCTLHLLLRDFPVVHSGFGARLWSKPWQPMAQAQNVAFLTHEIAATAGLLDHTVRFDVTHRPGVPHLPRSLEPLHVRPL